MHAAPALRAAALLLLLGLSGAQFGFDLAQVQQIVAQQTVRSLPRSLASLLRLLEQSHTPRCAGHAALHAMCVTDADARAPRPSQTITTVQTYTFTCAAHHACACSQPQGWSASCLPPGGSTLRLACDAPQLHASVA